MFGLIQAYLNDPLTSLYLLQAGNYLAASVAVRYGHDTVRHCYLAAALIYMLFGLAHSAMLLPH